MKRIAKFLKNKKALLIGAVFAVTFVTIAGVGVAQFGPDRPTKAYTQGTPGFDHVTFDSFTGVPNIGDERDFFTGKIATAPNGFYDPMNQVRDGNEILMRVYVHNNADSSLNASGKGVAKNTRVRVEVPSMLAQAQQAKAYISADNAQPQQVYDSLDVNANYPFKMDYVAGSATIKTNFMDKPISDDVVRGGVLIGDNALDGELPGCFEYVALVTFKVKINAPNYNLQKTVRLDGENSSQWKEVANTKPGSTVEWKLNFTNTGATTLNDVAISDRLPAKTTLVPGSTKIYNSVFPNGTPANTDAVSANGINVGNYNPKSNAIVTFKTKIAEKDQFECGSTTLLNSGFAKPSGQGTVTDTANVVVTRDDCKPENPQYSCDLLQTQIVSGRQVKFTTTASANGGATIKRYIYNFGDGTEVLKTDQASVDHTYAKDGQYASRVQVEVDVNGQTKVAESDKCAAAVSFNTPTIPPTTPGQPGTTTSLPNTGAGDIVAIFLAVTVSSTVAYAVVARRFTV